MCLRHAYQLFSRQLVNSENQDVPTLVDDKVKLFIPDKRYSENSNVFPKATDQSIYQKINVFLILFLASGVGSLFLD